MRVRARQNVVLVRRVTTPIYRLALLIQRELLVDRVPVALDVAVQVRDVEGNDGALRVVPRPVADALARVDPGLTGRGRCAEIGMPCPAARACRTSQRLTVLVGAGEAAEVST